MGTIIPYPRPHNHNSDGELSDEALLAAIATGDTEALGFLYDRYHRDVYAFLFTAMAVYRSDLDDLVHDTFLAAYDSAHRFSRRSSVKTWLFGIAVNVRRNYVRTTMRRHRAFERLPVPNTQPLQPDEHVQSTQELSRLADAISELPDELREAYVTCVMEGLSSNDAARVLRVRKGTLWRRVHQARRLLRQQIGRSET